jgi:SAM-dependent methyltransferase
MSKSDLQQRRQREKTFYDDKLRSISNRWEDLTLKIFKISHGGAWFLESLKRHRKLLVSEGRVLEIGAGYGWAACMYKYLFPGAHVITTDLSEASVEDRDRWERLFGVQVDTAYACSSDDIPEPDASMDMVFCFSSGHHFVQHGDTLKELHRVLKPGASAIYFHEPTSPRYLYRLARWRVNRKRPGVPEDVLIPSRLRRLARDSGLEASVIFCPHTQNRGEFETLYYGIMRRLRMLQYILPSTADFVFTRSE